MSPPGPAPAGPAPLLELRGIRKAFPGVVALDDVGFTIARGEVVGLIGENGAGKSTLMKVLGGVVTPDAGEIVMDGAARPSLTVAASLGTGIAFVHQELNLFDNLDVGANVLIGREPLLGGPFRLVDRRRLRAIVEPLLRRLAADFTADTPVAALSIAQRQLVEIAKALSLDARLIIMDEPTSSLTLAETARLLEIVADLKAHGVAVIYITHRLNEVVTCADRVVCLRDGRVVGTLARHAIEPATMIKMMIGRDLRSLYVPPGRAAGRGCAIRGLRTGAFPGRTVDLDIGAGEIVGLAGLVGAGRTSLARALFGVEPALGGAIVLDGVPVRIGSVRAAIALGIYLAPEDRKRMGLVTELPIRENVSLADLGRLARLGLIDRRAEAQLAERQRARLGIRAPSIEVPAAALSGGNQQKVVLAKWLAMRPRLVIFDEPTRGIDVGAKSEVYALLRELADHGVAILMISSDMEEVIGVSDRVAVMHEGAITGELGRDALSEHAVLRLAVGHATH
jgi:ribose transport system ATP-binding protein